MKTTALITAALLSLPLAVGSAWAETKKWSIAPGEVLQVASNPNQLSGSFTFREDPASGIESTRYGGACYVADLTSQGIGAKTCASDVDCNPVTTRGTGSSGASGAVSPTAYEGYCLKSPEASSAPEGRPNRANKCWVRPGTHKDYCTSSKTLAIAEVPVALQPGAYDLPTVPGDPTGAGRPVSWRIHSCLNGIGGGPPCSDRASSNKEQNNGPIYTYRPKGP